MIWILYSNSIEHFIEIVGVLILLGIALMLVGGGVSQYRIEKEKEMKEKIRKLESELKNAKIKEKSYEKNLEQLETMFKALSESDKKIASEIYKKVREIEDPD